MSDPSALPPSVLAQILSTQISAPSSQSAPPPNAQIIEIPAELQNLVTTRIISADVVRQSSEGVLTLRSDQGNLTLKTSLTFEPQDTLAVRIQGADVFLRLISDAHGQPPAAPLLHYEHTQPLSLSQLLETDDVFVTPLPRDAAAKLVQPFAQLSAATITSPPLTKFVLSPSPVSQTLYALPQATTPPDLQVSLSPITTKVPLRTIAAQLPLIEPVISDAYAPKDRAPLKISVTDVHSPAATLQSTDKSLLSAQRAGQIRAVFTGLTPEQHFPVFQTISEAPQLFALRAPISEAIPIGTEINISVLQTQNVLPLSVSLPPVISAPWQILNEVSETLSQQAARHVSHAFQASIPSPSAPAQMASSVLFFLVAVRSGDASGWLGDKAVQALKKAGKGDVITRLSNEFSALNRSDAGAGDWRVMALPMAWQEQIHKVSVSYRKEDARSEDEAHKGSQTRFVMDLRLSAMGKVQLDALFHSWAKRLDLIVRTEGNFSEAARQHMREVYKNALDETGVSGELSFVGRAKDWVRVDEGKAPKFLEEI